MGTLICVTAGLVVIAAVVDLYLIHLRGKRRKALVLRRLHELTSNL